MKLSKRQVKEWREQGKQKIQAIQKAFALNSKKGNR